MNNTKEDVYVEITTEIISAGQIVPKGIYKDGKNDIKNPGSVYMSRKIYHNIVSKIEYEIYDDFVNDDNMKILNVAEIDTKIEKEREKEIEKEREREKEREKMKEKEREKEIEKEKERE